jgi:hypothetical protein
MEERAKWAPRDEPVTVRRCVVPRCGAPAVAGLRIDAERSRAWLLDLAPDVAEVLCPRHVAALVTPPGWSLHDARSRTAASTIPSVALARRDHERAKHALAVAPAPVALPPVVLTQHEPAPPGAADVDAERATDGDAEAEPPAIDELLDAQSPLLARAFAKSRDS